MTITIEAPAEIEAAITRKAERAGISLSEFALRALLVTEPEVLGATADAQNAKALMEQDRKARLLAAIAFVKSGYFARTGLSTEDLFAERREDLRLEQLREADG